MKSDASRTPLTLMLFAYQKLTSQQNILTLSLKYLTIEFLGMIGTQTVAVHVFTYTYDMTLSYYLISPCVTRWV